MDAVYCGFFEMLALAFFCQAAPKSKSVRVLKRQVSGGLIYERKCRKTGTTIGLYYSADSYEEDPETPYATVCNEHGGITCHVTRRDARAWMTDPTTWCDDCRDNLGRNP